MGTGAAQPIFFDILIYKNFKLIGCKKNINKVY
jgi:hypothetical protein